MHIPFDYSIEMNQAVYTEEEYAMKRLKSKHQFRKQLHKLRSFLYDNLSLLFLIVLLLLGAFLGTWVFRILNEEHRAFAANLLYSPPIPADPASAASAVLSACMGHACLLILLFLFGMTAFGCPLILLCVIFFGFRLGVIECFSFVSYGFGYTALNVHIPMLIAGIAVLMAVKRSLHMSCVFSRQLLPSGAHCGGMWLEFKRYLLYYLISLGMVVASAITEVLLQIINSLM